MFELALALGSEDRERAREAERAIERVLRAASARDLIQLATAARAQFRHGFGAPPPKSALGPDWVDKLAALHPVAVACLGSIHRNGYYREAAVHYLAQPPGQADALGTPFLLLRADDIVETIRSAAEAAIERRLVPARALEFVRALPIVELLRGRARGGAGPLVRKIHELLLSCPDALRTAGDDAFSTTRFAAYRLRLQVEPAGELLAAALADTDTRIRTWAARQAISGTTSDAEKRALLPVLEASGAPFVRNLAVRARAKLDADDAALERALLDHHAVVRYSARASLRARHPDREFGEARRVALRALARPDATARELIGALGALADVGLTEDIEVVRRFATHPSSRVRAEAERTLRSLQAT